MRNESDANQALATQAVRAIAEQLRVSAERARWAAVLMAPARRAAAPIRLQGRAVS